MENNKIKVSVVMPIRNEAKFIEKSLNTIFQQDFPKEQMEIIVVDGMSVDGTRDILHRIKNEQVRHLKLIDNPQKIVPTGMNLAIQAAQGDFIVRVDGHTLLEKDYVRQCVDLLQSTDAENVGGPMRAIGDGYVAEAIAVGTSTPFGIGNSVFHYSREEKSVDTVYMGSFRRSTLFRIGLYDERFVRHQDYELNYRIREAGGKITLSPRIKSYYYVRNSLKKLWTQYFQYGTWKGKIIKHHVSSTRWRHTIPPLFVLSIVILSIGSIFSSAFRWLLIADLGLYVFFLVIAALVTSINSRQWKFFPILPFVFGCLHLSYGIGVWLGLLSSKMKKRNRTQSESSTISAETGI